VERRALGRSVVVFSLESPLVRYRTLEVSSRSSNDAMTYHCTAVLAILVIASSVSCRGDSAMAATPDPSAPVAIHIVAGNNAIAAAGPSRS